MLTSGIIEREDRLHQTPDVCLQHRFSLLRAAVLTVLFLIVIPGTIGWLIVVGDRMLWVQVGSVVSYTAAVALYTFARTRRGQPYLISCPVVRNELPRLAKRHLVFLAALVIIETGSFELRSNLSSYFTTSTDGDPAPFAMMLFVIAMCLATAEILTNRSLLEGAHDMGE